MTDLQIYLLGLAKFIGNFWLVFIYIIAALIFLGRHEKLEEKRLEKAIKRQKARRIYND